MVSLVPAEEQTKAEDEVVLTQVGETYVLENRQVKAVVDGKGEVISFVLKTSGREFAAEPLNRFHLYKDVPRLFDAWDIDSNYKEQEITGGRGCEGKRSSGRQPARRSESDRTLQQFFLCPVYPSGC